MTSKQLDFARFLHFTVVTHMLKFRHILNREDEMGRLFLGLLLLNGIAPYALKA